MKDYHVARGIPLDAGFAEHAESCERCRQFDPVKPETGASLCLEGSVLWKRENERRPRHKPAGSTSDMFGFKVSKNEAKRLTRHKT